MGPGTLRVPSGTLWLGALLAIACGARAQQPAQRPQLCLNIAGHTAPVLTMAFSADSRLLFTAGLDKAVHVWRLPDRLAAAGDQAAQAVLTGHIWAEERTLRWSIGRGQRGSIYAMAICPKTGELALGGYGARGTLGDVAVLDPARPAAVRVREEHRETIMSLTFAGSAGALASMDRSGRLVLWPADGGKPRTLAAADADSHGPAVARAIAASLRLRPVAAAGDQYVAAPVYTGPSQDGKSMTWRVRLYGISGQGDRTLPTPHYGVVTALACTPDGRCVASADQARQLLVWDVRTTSAKRLPTSLPVVSLAFSPSGNILVAGTAAGENPATAAPGGSRTGSELQIWDVATGQLRCKRSLSEPVYTCAVSLDGRKLAYVGALGHDVLVEPLDDPAAPVQAAAPLRIAGGPQATAVGVVGTNGKYRLVFGTLPEPVGTAKGRVFDPQKLEVGPWAPPVPQAPATCGDWQAVADRKNNGLALFAAGASMGILQVDRERQGIIQSFCWVSGPDGAPLAIAVGTNIQCGVYVYGLPEAGACPLLRYFRGHYDLVSALAVSGDGRILVSGSRDGTIRCWPLRDLYGPSAIRRRWGAELAEQNGRVVVAAIDEFGPLGQQQVRAGDIVTKILWLDGQTARSETQAGEILARLAQLPWYAQVSFCTSRQGAELPPFNLVGGWHELLGLYATDRDWIAWTPSGYYACSAGGEQLIGWQVNSEDLRQAPSFFSADKFSKVFYRPDLIRSLLATGSLSAAVQPGRQPPADVNEIRPPAVKTVLVEERHLEHATRVRIAATAESKDDHPLVAMQLLLDGRPYGESRVFPPDDPAGRKRREDWLIELTPGQHQIAVQAEGEKSYATDEIELTCPGEVQVKPTLRCLCVGVSDYPGNLRLRYGHSDARAFASILDRNAAPIFGKVEIKTLVESRAKKRDIEAGLQWLQTAAAWNDVSVFFFAGHGLSGEAGSFFLLPIDGSAERPGPTCVGDTLLKEFCRRTPGKVMVFLDACRAASVKIDVNDLALKLGRNDCGAIVITSSTGQQQSLEAPAWSGGAFTKALVDGLEGRADLFRTGYVSSPYDIACYVDHVVRTLTDQRQTPVCAAPRMPQFKITRATVH
ncbi:MAG: caspase family protein [Thermoguttaceae bacterium]|jgi:WD40 repeat protein